MAAFTANFVMRPFGCQLRRRDDGQTDGYFNTSAGRPFRPPQARLGIGGVCLPMPDQSCGSKRPVLDCGVPFAMVGGIWGAPAGCPLPNLIPEWNDMVIAVLREAYQRLTITNDFPNSLAGLSRLM